MNPTALPALSTNDPWILLDAAQAVRVEPGTAPAAHAAGDADGQQPAGILVMQRPVK